MQKLTAAAESIVQQAKPGFVDPMTVIAVIEAVVQLVKMFRECRAKHATPQEIKAAHPLLYWLRLRGAVSQSLRNHSLPQGMREGLCDAVDAKVTAAHPDELAALVAEAESSFPS